MVIMSNVCKCFSVKTWGSSSDKPILVTHGRMDNLGSFDRLIPLLPKSFYYICIDLPSHGKSTFLPPYFPIHAMDFVMVYKLVMDHFKKDKYILLGHSLGAIIGNCFAQLYPEYIEKMIGIDSAVAYTPVGLYKDYVTIVFEKVKKIHDRESVVTSRTYTEEEAVAKVANGRWGEPIAVEAAKPLTQRILEPVGKSV